MTDTAIDVDDDTREGIDLRPNGSVHLWVDGKRIKLRTPRVRDMRALRQAYDDLNDVLSPAIRESLAFSAKLRDALLERGADAELTDEERAEDDRRTKQLNQLIETEMLGWWRDAIQRLGDGRITFTDVDSDTGDGDGDMPAWMMTQGSPLPLIQHWRTIPSPSGVQPQ